MIGSTTGIELMNVWQWVFGEAATALDIGGGRGGNLLEQNVGVF